MKHLLITLIVGSVALLSVSSQAQTSQSKSATPVMTAQPAPVAQSVSPKPAMVATLPTKAQHTARIPQPDILAQPAVRSASVSTAHVSATHASAPNASAPNASAAPHAKPQPDLLPHSALGTAKPTSPEHVQAAPAPAKPE